MSRAVSTALAYVLATGYTPKGLHMNTWSEVNRRCVLRKGFTGPLYTLTDEGRALAEVSPLGKSCAFLAAQGFAPIPAQHGTSRYVEYRHEDDRRATAYRDGDAIIYRRNGEKPPFNQTESRHKFSWQ